MAVRSGRVFRPALELVRRDERAELLADLSQKRVAARPDLASMYDDLVAVVEARSLSSGKWSYLMQGAVEFAQVSEHLASSSRVPRPLVAVRLWALLPSYVDGWTGLVLASRSELAQRLGVAPEDVSRITSELVRVGALIRERVKVPGQQGPGVVRFRFSPRIATRLPHGTRDAAQAAAPPLLVAGTDVPGSRRAFRRPCVVEAL